MNWMIENEWKKEWKEVGRGRKRRRDEKEGRGEISKSLNERERGKTNRKE